MTRPTYDTLVVGSYWCDLIYTGLSELPRLGADVFSRSFDMVPGGTYYTVKVLHLLGLHTGWICDFGNDFFSRFIHESAVKDGFDVSLARQYDRPRRVISSSFSFKHDRGFMSFEDEPFHQPEYEELAALNFHSIVLPGITDWPTIATIDRLPDRKNIILYLDCQHADQTIHTPGVEDALRQVDVFAPNECEALHFTGEPTLERALDVLARIVPLVVVKRSGKGSIARRGEQLWEVPGIQVDVVDTTGAGDSFNAGFLYAYLRGLPVDTCLRYGNITGGLSVTGVGPLSVPDPAVIHEMAEHYEKYQAG